MKTITVTTEELLEMVDQELTLQDLVDALEKRTGKIVILQDMDDDDDE